MPDPVMPSVADWARASGGHPESGTPLPDLVAGENPEDAK